MKGGGKSVASTPGKGGFCVALWNCYGPDSDDSFFRGDLIPVEMAFFCS